MTRGLGDSSNECDVGARMWMWMSREERGDDGVFLMGEIGAKVWEGGE